MSRYTEHNLFHLLVASEVQIVVLNSNLFSKNVSLKIAT